MNMYLGQRCHVQNVGYGTIVVIADEWIRVEIDGQVSRWYAASQVEPLPTYPAGGNL